MSLYYGQWSLKYPKINPLVMSRYKNDYNMKNFYHWNFSKNYIQQIAEHNGDDECLMYIQNIATVHLKTNCYD